VDGTKQFYNDDMTGGYKPKTRLQWHYYWVLHDPEFRREAYNVSDYERSKYWKTQGINIRGAEQIAEDEKLVVKLLEKYAVPREIFDRSLAGDLKRSSFEPVVSTVVDEANNVIEVRFRADITKNDYIEGWDDVYSHLKLHGLKNTKSRSRSPDETQLIYAIFKARLLGMTYRKIFELYKSASLPYYESEATGYFLTQEDMERYYQKYRPDR
jgi:hypothetical protein